MSEVGPLTGKKKRRIDGLQTSKLSKERRSKEGNGKEKEEAGNRQRRGKEQAKANQRKRKGKKTRERKSKDKAKIILKAEGKHPQGL